MTMGRWDVFRDAEGKSVTINEDQLHAIWHAVATVRKVRAAEHYPPVGGNGWEVNLAKSRLLGRLLIDGRPPLDDKPPGYLGARAYHAIEPDLSHYYLGHGPRWVRVVEDRDGNLITEPIDPRTMIDNDERDDR